MNNSVRPNQRCFGEYRCPTCRRLWMSSNTWPGYGQDCQTCKVTVMPHKMTPLERPNGLNEKIDITKPHPQHLCGKCRALGRYCGQRY